MQDTIQTRNGKTLGKDMLGDLMTLGRSLRSIDIMECTAMGAKDGIEGLLLSVMCSESWWIEYAMEGTIERPIWAYGIGRDYHEGLGYCIWLLGADVLDTQIGYRKYFLRESKKVIQEWQRTKGPLWNCISKDNVKAIRWLRWLGATFIESDRIPEGFQLFILPRIERT